MTSIPDLGHVIGLNLLERTQITHIEAVSFTGEGSRSTRKESPTLGIKLKTLSRAMRFKRRKILKSTNSYTLNQ